MAMAVSMWALAWLALCAGLVAAIPRLGRARVAVWLTWIGLLLLTIEDGLLTAWYALAAPPGQGSVPWLSDPEGVAGIAPDQVRAGMLVTAAWAVCGAVLVGWLVRRGLLRLEPAAWWGSALTLACVGSAHAATSLLLFSRGLPLPAPGGSVPGFGWEPVAVGLAAWGAALVIAYEPVLGGENRLPLRSAVASS